MKIFFVFMFERRFLLSPLLINEIVEILVFHVNFFLSKSEKRERK